jgi:hypothetical protein
VGSHSTLWADGRLGFSSLSGMPWTMCRWTWSRSTIFIQCTLAFQVSVKLTRRKAGSLSSGMSKSGCASSTRSPRKAQM